MTTIALDTSSATLKVGVWRSALLSSVVSAPPATHAATILPSIEKALRDAGVGAREVELIAVAGGPGSFTGLRIGISSAKGLSLSLGIPMVLVPTLDIYGEAWKELSGTVVPVIDARKHRLYCARYHRGSLIGEWLDIDADGLLAKLRDEEETHFVGPDAELMDSLCQERPGWRVHEAAIEAELGALARLGIVRYREHGPAAASEGPLYLREPEIGEPLAR